jgi:hypothetical protein
MIPGSGRHSNVRAIGICDTPSELFIALPWRSASRLSAWSLTTSAESSGLGTECSPRRRDRTARLLPTAARWPGLPGRSFRPSLLAALADTDEYVSFYFAAPGCPESAGGRASRGEEIYVWSGLLAGLANDIPVGKPFRLERYKRYLNQRNASYMRSGNAELLSPRLSKTGILSRRHRISPHRDEGDGAVDPGRRRHGQCATPNDR